MKDTFPIKTIMSVVPSPIVMFTHLDAVKVAQMTPAQMVPDHENIVAVASMTNLDQMSQKLGQMVVTHYSKSKRTGKQNVEGSWAVMVAIEGTAEPHIFRVVWPDDTKPDGPVIVPDKGPVTAHA